MLVDPWGFIFLLLFMTALGMACGFWIGRVHERDIWNAREQRRKEARRRIHQWGPGESRTESGDAK